jgi:3-deoxy-D-manno-octulosonic acid (KDO) 8-phosphate synthase
MNKANLITLMNIYNHEESQKEDLNKNYYMIDISFDIINNANIENYSSGTLNEILKALDSIKEKYAKGVLYDIWKETHYYILDLYLLYYKEERNLIK